ncbi:MAG: hypothetical protein ACYDEF_15350 [Methanosarcina sp.]
MTATQPTATTFVLFQTTLVTLHTVPAPVTSHVHCKAEYLGPWEFTTRSSRRSFTLLTFLNGLFRGCNLFQAGLHGYAVLRPGGLR